MTDRNDQRYLAARNALERDHDATILRSGKTPEQLRTQAQALRDQITPPAPDLSAFETWQAERAAAFDDALSDAAALEVFAIADTVTGIDALAWLSQRLEGNPLAARVTELVNAQWTMPESAADIEDQALELDAAADILDQRQSRAA